MADAVRGEHLDSSSRVALTRSGRQLRPNLGGAANATNNFRDPAFADNKALPLHRWVPWIAGFSASFVQDCLDAFLPKPSEKGRRICVLDPFAGVGTTLVQALLNPSTGLSRARSRQLGAGAVDCVGFEINPWAALACRAKLHCLNVDPGTFEQWCDRYRSVAEGEHRGYARAVHATPRQPCPEPGRGSSGQAAHGRLKPEAFKTRIPFFSAPVERQVLVFLDFVDGITQREIVDLFRVALGSVMVSFSNYTYEPSLGSRSGAGKPLIEHADVPAAIIRKLSEMAADIRWLKQHLPAAPARDATSQVHNLSFLESQNVLPPACVDLVVTSPPYLNNYHYVRNTRPQLYWLSLVSSPEQLRRLEQANFGTYWQTVRDADPVALTFDHPDLAAQLKRLRQTRVEKGPYGGLGWANYAASYFNDCFRFSRVLRRALARGGVAVIVIGNSIIQGHEIKTDRLLADIARQNGLSLVEVREIRSKRVGASITASAVRQGKPSNAALYESAVILRKN